MVSINMKLKFKNIYELDNKVNYIDRNKLIDMEYSDKYTRAWDMIRDFAVEMQMSKMIGLTQSKILINKKERCA